MATREQNIETSFLAYNAATQTEVQSGRISAEQADVYNQLGLVIRAAVDATKNTTDGEVMALLWIAQDFAKTLIGLSDSDEGKATVAGRYYRKEVAQRMLQMVKEGAIHESSLPGQHNPTTCEECVAATKLSA
jgi:hypothetical protein